jgi:photosystem II stability/assembly factor-like uncharacterized protein
MLPRRRISFWSISTVLLGFALAALSSLPSRADDKPLPQKEIAELEKQIQDLTRRLNALKASSQTPAPTDGALPEAWVKQLNWRPIGPATMGGRITALAVYEADPCTYWVATASGGLLKTTNGGTTFVHQFDREATVSIGDVAVAASNPNIVWVGTGENNPRNSVSYGDGVYKSTDGGKTWTNVGLKKSFQIGRIAIHPKNPDIVYVGALGRLYGRSEERGLFKTTDGGKTWQKVLYIDDKTGVIDVHMNPADPETLLVATWERQRDGFDTHPGTEMPPAEGYDRYDPIKKWGPGSGIHKTNDGGKSWNKLTKGLPTVALGRISLDFYRKDPKTIFAIIDTEKIGMGTPPVQMFLGVQGENAPGGAKLTAITENSPAMKAGLKAGDVVKAFDKVEIKTYDQLGEQINKHKPGDKVNLKVERDKETKDFEVTLENRSAPSGVYLGMTGEQVEGGIKVRDLAEGGPAVKAGLKPDDVIVSLEGKPVKELREVSQFLRGKTAGHKLALKVKRGNDVNDVTVTLEARPNPAARRPYSFFYGGQRENAQDQQGPDSFQYGGVYKSTDAGESWTRINSVNPRPMYFSHVRVDPSDDKYVYVCGISLYRSKDGGKTFQPNGGNGVHPDQHTLWIDPKDGRHMIIGTDGGFYVTHDRMDHWDHVNHMALGQFYHVTVDSRQPYHVYGGLQDNGSWGGPSRSLSGPGPTNEDWIVVSGGDGFQCRVDPNDPDLVYFESQDGAMARRNLRTGEFRGIRPPNRPGQPPYRFNWNTPFILSAHNPRIFYCAGNFVFRSLKQGDELKPISPEITPTKRGSATALAESPRNPDVLWVGTDDGGLWITRDGGAKWTNVTPLAKATAPTAGVPMVAAGLAGWAPLAASMAGRGQPSADSLPGPRWVASIEASRAVEGRAYVVFDAHRSDDDNPYVFVTEDFGQSWKSLRANLPMTSTRVCREDVINPNLLYLGTEFAAYASTNRGASWTKINNNLPTVAVHEFAIHPTAGEVVAATHGRSLWVLDVTALRQVTAEALKADATLLKPNTAIRWRSEPGHGSLYGHGSRRFAGQNPPPGAQVYYALGKKATKVTLKVVDYAGQTVKELSASVEPGLHHAAWDLTRNVTRRGPVTADLSAEPAGPARRGPRVLQGIQAAPPGMYRVVLTVDGKEFAQPLRVESDPTLPTTLFAEDEDKLEPAKTVPGDLDK